MNLHLRHHYLELSAWRDGNHEEQVTMREEPTRTWCWGQGGWDFPRSLDMVEPRIRNRHSVL